MPTTAKACHIVAIKANHSLAFVAATAADRSPTLATAAVVHSLA